MKYRFPDFGTSMKFHISIEHESWRSFRCDLTVEADDHNMRALLVPDASVVFRATSDHGRAVNSSVKQFSKATLRDKLRRP